MPVTTSQTTVCPAETKGSEELDQRAGIRQPNKVSMDTAFAVAGAYETLCLTSVPASPRARLLFGAVL